MLVQPKIKKDGDFVEARWIDEDRLGIDGAPMVELAVNKDGPDKPAPIR